MGACFLHGQNGGGNLLRLKVVGSTSAPSNPKENTIWIKTSVPILGCQVFFNELTYGDFWKGQGNGSVYIPFQAANSSYWASTGANITVQKRSFAEFNVNFLGCKQLINDEWVSMDAYIYHGSSWIQFSSVWNGELYMEGTWYTANTGDWTALGKELESDSYTPMAPSVQNETNYFKLSFPSDGSGMFYLAMDLSQYTTLHFEGELNPYRSEQEIRARLNIWSSIGTYTTSNVVAYLAKSGLNNGVGSIDVSSLNGTYYIGFNLYQEYSNILCKKLYLT